MLRMLLMTALLVVCPVPAAADRADDSNASDGFSTTVRGEVGFLDPLWHKIQLGREGTYFDYVEEGGQDVLFRFIRLSVDFEFGTRHHAIFLYQPLKLETQVKFRRDVTIDGTVFEKGTAVDTLYKFPFYRASYLYDFAASPAREIALGASLQLRNATIAFTAADGSRREANRDVGPVPVIKFRTEIPIGDCYWFGAEFDGFYAPIKYVNGSSKSDAEGAIADVSLRFGRELGRRFGGFINLRYLGGGSTGESQDAEGRSGEGFTKNWLHFATVSLGMSWEIVP